MKELPIVCTLGDAERADRIAEWRAVLATATGREELPGGVRLRYDRAVDVAALAALAAAENDCCRWATFTLTIGPDEVTLEVSGSPTAQPAIAKTYGAA